MKSMKYLFLGLALVAAQYAYGFIAYTNHTGVGLSMRGYAVGSEVTVYDVYTHTYETGATNVAWTWYTKEANLGGDGQVIIENHYAGNYEVLLTVKLIDSNGRETISLDWKVLPVGAPREIYVPKGSKVVIHGVLLDYQISTLTS